MSSTTGPARTEVAPASAPGALMAAEIAEQPQGLARLLREGKAPIGQVARAVAARRPRFALLAARGTSDHAALYAKYLVEVGLELPAGLASPSSMTVLGARPALDGVLWVAISQSGGSPDLVESTLIARARGAITVALTNAPGSALAEAAEFHLEVLAGPERAVAATKSYTHQMLTAHLFVTALREELGAAPGSPSPLSAVTSALPEAASAALEIDVAELVSRYRFAARLVTTGRAFSYPTAREAALKVMETSYLPAHAFSGADLMHGPMAMIDHDQPVIAIVPPGPAGLAMVPVLQRLHAQGADVAVLGRLPEGTTAQVVLDLPGGLGADLAAIVQIMPLQGLAHGMSLARGYNPDAPRGLSKETHTR